MHDAREGEEQRVLERAAADLRTRPEFLVLGAVVGVDRVPWPGGGWGTVPRAWAAIRDATEEVTDGH